MRNPITVKDLAKQIISASDAYTALNMAENEFKDLLYHYARCHGNKLFSASEPGMINPTIKSRIGKKRMHLVNLILEGYQLSW